MRTLRDRRQRHDDASRCCCRACGLSPVKRPGIGAINVAEEVTRRTRLPITCPAIGARIQTRALGAHTGGAASWVRSCSQNWARTLNGSFRKPSRATFTSRSIAHGRTSRSHLRAQARSWKQSVSSGNSRPRWESSPRPSSNLGANASEAFPRASSSRETRACRSSPHASPGRSCTRPRPSLSAGCGHSERIFADGWSPTSVPRPRG